MKRLALLTTTLVILLVVSSSLLTGFVNAQADVCDSTFHKTRLTTVVSNPPIGFTDILTVTEPAKHFQLECLYINQVGQPIRECASPPNQRLNLCHQPLESNPSTASDWTCLDISQYLNTQFSRVVIGSSSGPELRIKIQWASQLSNPDCYPRTFDILMVGLPVPEPGTELGASIAFILVVVAVAGGAVAYGFYALWRVSKKFEHRDENPNNNSLTSPGAAHNKSREQYRAALAALGAPEEMIQKQGGLYDEDDGEENQDDDQGHHYDNQEGLYEDDEEGEEGYDEEGYDGEQDPHQQLNFSADSNNTNNNNFVVLDNNEVVHSEAKPIPWFEKMKQQQQRRNNNNDTGLVDSPSETMNPSPSSASASKYRARRQQQQQRPNVAYADDDDDGYNNNNTNHHQNTSMLSHQSSSAGGSPQQRIGGIRPPPPRVGTTNTRNLSPGYVPKRY